jgi:signal peptidase II
MLVLVAFDQLTKTWASCQLSINQPVIILGDWLRLVLVHNRGLIWGLPIKSFLSYYLLPIIGIIFIVYLVLRTKSEYFGIAYGFVVSGAIGNLIDRIRLGYVVDFIDMGIKNTRWATYNIADTTIVIGLILVLARELFKSNKKIESKVS